METSITSYCKIKNNTVVVNDKQYFKGTESDELSAFLGALYKQMDLSYPKFFKMDKLCKLGTLATELVIRNNIDLDNVPKNEIALVFSNNSSSLESDRNHANSISDKENYFPSPSVFVYTLPNIVIGEIAIKHKITGENAFFVSGKFDADLMHNYSSILLQNSAISTVICGWVNVDGNSSEAFVYCIKNLNFKQENNVFQKQHNLQQLYSL
ncbi:MAG: 3-oxoacyl-ACP synthase [Bacteroidia bacterium]